MSDSLPFICFDFTVGGIVTTPAQARRALKEDYARWEAEKSAASETADRECVEVLESVSVS